MNLKKFISGVSALAVAASAFAGLAVTASAADPVVAYSQDFSTPTVEGTAKSEITKGFDSSVIEAYLPTDFGFATATTCGLNSAAKCTAYVDNALILEAASDNGNSRGYEYAASFDAIGVGNEVSVSYKWNIGSATGNNTKSYVETYLSDASGNKILSIRYYGQSKQLNVNGATSSFDRNQNVTVNATFDMNTQKITALSLNNGSKDVYAISEPIAFANANATSVSKFGFAHAGAAASWSNTSSVDDINISYTEAKVAVNSIVVNYTYEGNVIYSDDTISLDGKYVGDTANIPFRKYIFQNGVLYQTTRSNSNPYYGVSTAMTLNTVVEKALSVVTPAEGTSFVALYDDGSDTSNSADIRGSYMTAKRGDIELGSVEPGIYEITYNQYIRGGAPALYLDDEKVCDLNKHESSWGEATTSDIQITKAGSLTIKSVDLTDWVLLKKTGDYVAPAPNLGATFEQETVNGTEDYANEAATWFIITVANTGDAAGTFNTVSITDGTKTGTYSAPNTTIDADAEIVYGGVVEGAYTFTSASVD